MPNEEVVVKKSSRVVRQAADEHISESVWFDARGVLRPAIPTNGDWGEAVSATRPISQLRH